MMSDQNPTRPGLAPMGADEPAPRPAASGVGTAAMQRPMRRAPAFDPANLFVPPEPHEKYHIPEEMLDPDMDYFWLPTKVFGELNARVQQYYRAGWMPTKASDFPKISGYGVEFPQVMIDMGLLTNVGADAPMIVDDMMLVQRHKQLSQQARKKERAEADALVRDQMAKLKQSYRQVGDQPGVSRRIAPLTNAQFYDEGV